MAEQEFGTLTTEVKAVGDVDDRTLRFIGTTAVRDRMGDEIPLSGWDFKAYRKNPVVLWAHDYSTPPVGKVTKIAREDLGDGKKGWVFDVKFAKGEKQRLAEQVYDLCQQGMLNAVSVGFKSLASKWIEESEDEKEARKKETPDNHPGKVFSKKELLELSLVPVPANPEALMVARKKGMELPKELNAVLDSIALERASEALATTREIKAQLAAMSDDVVTSGYVHTEGDTSANVPPDYVTWIDAGYTPHPNDNILKINTITKPGWDDEEGSTEIKYRVREPSAFEEGSFKRITLQKQKPRVIAVVGKLKGQDTLTIQALRFPKDDGWTLKKAKAWVKEHPDVVKIIDEAAKVYQIKDMHRLLGIVETVLPDVLAEENETTRDDADDVALPEGENAETGVDEDVATKTSDTPALPPEENAETTDAAGIPEEIPVKRFKLVKKASKVFRLIRR